MCSSEIIGPRELQWFKITLSCSPSVAVVYSQSVNSGSKKGREVITVQKHKGDFISPQCWISGKFFQGSQLSDLICNKTMSILITNKVTDTPRE